MARPVAFSSASGRYFLREVLPADWPELTDLWIESWQQTFPAIDFAARRGWFVDRLVALRDEGTGVLVAAFDRATGAMAGFVALEPQRHWLDQIAVAPCFAGKQAASDLMAVAEDLAGGHLMLDVNVDNARALRFYLGRGFRITGEGVNPASGLKTLTMDWRRAPQERLADDTDH